MQLWQSIYLHIFVCALEIVSSTGQVRFGFKSSTYTVGEADGKLQVCLNVSNFDGTSFSGTLTFRNGTATSGEDYSDDEKSVGIQSFIQKTDCENIDIIDDNSYEGSENFTVVLMLNDPNVQITIGEATVTITDNDAAPPPPVTFGFQSSTYTVGEGDGQLQVCLNVSNFDGTSFSGTLTFRNGTATSGEDYKVLVGFDKDVGIQSFIQTTDCVDIPIIDDNSYEGNENFTVVLMLNDPNVQITIGEATVTITDNEDFDECIAKSHNCHQNAYCSNTDGSFNCSCMSGYFGNGTDCEDIDECDATSHNCHDNAYCNNTNGFFNCTCKKGYSGNGTDCRDIDECFAKSHNCHHNAYCNNTDGSFNCSCKSGYFGDGTDCEDIDECGVSPHNCHDNAYCNNTNGSFNCTCKNGYSGNGTDCRDIDECIEKSHNCHHNAYCNNTDGSFNCSCKSGYLGNGTDCGDIDECGVSPHNCHDNAYCDNTNGSFNCTCKNGYSGNGTDCRDIDECIEKSHNCHHNAYCNNTDGSFNCSCKSGFLGNGTDCEDIDECGVNSHNCLFDGYCKNTDGSFNCICKKDYPVNGTDCRDVEQCIENLTRAIVENDANLAGSVIVRVVIMNREYQLGFNNRSSLEYTKTALEMCLTGINIFRSANLTSQIASFFVANLTNGSLAVDIVLTFNDVTGITYEDLQRELAATLIVTNSGTFLPGTNLQLSANTDPASTELAGLFIFEDIDECKPAQIIQAPDCGENATCVNRNLTYDCICNEGFVKNGSDCIVAPIFGVDKSVVEDVKHVLRVVLGWLGLCFAVALVIVIITGFRLLEKNRQYDLKPRVITAPAHRPTFNNLYYGNENYPL
ncbi:fibrillin-3-like isoform X2 [Dendronephthya gigantea]|nr:fibrillin-3-like isoform X2 [Dendronephthya gigantea]